MSISPHSGHAQPIEEPLPAVLRRRVSTSRWWIGVACLAVAGLTGAAWASTDPLDPAERLPATARVAGPDPGTDPAAAGRPVTNVPRPTAPVVTRALVRARIEAIDPARWLARFGPVEQSHDEAR